MSTEQLHRDRLGLEWMLQHFQMNFGSFSGNGSVTKMMFSRLGIDVPRCGSIVRLLEKVIYWEVVVEFEVEVVVLLDVARNLSHCLRRRLRRLLQPLIIFLLPSANNHNFFNAALLCT